MSERTPVEIILDKRQNQRFISLRDLIYNKQAELISYQEEQLKAVRSKDDVNIAKFTYMVAYVKVEIEEFKRLNHEN